MMEAEVQDLKKFVGLSMKGGPEPRPVDGRCKVGMTENGYCPQAFGMNAALPAP